jgi:hypothetical protein
VLPAWQVQQARLVLQALKVQPELLVSLAHPEPQDHKVFKVSRVQRDLLARLVQPARQVRRARPRY